MGVLQKLGLLDKFLIALYKTNTLLFIFEAVSNFNIVVPPIKMVCLRNITTIAFCIFYSVAG